MTRPRLRLVGGVCAGFAQHTGMPVALVRTATALLAACGGAGVLLYGWLWAVVPASAREGAAPPPPTGAAGTAGARRSREGAADAAPGLRQRPVAELLLGLALLASGVAIAVGRLGGDVPLPVVIPAIVVLAGVALAWRQFADVRSGAARGSSGFLVRTLGALVCVALGILLFFVTGDRPNLWTVVTAALAVLAGVGLAVAPWLVRLTRDLADERAARARDAERAEIAAHLHDSVLQTLALIQQKAGPRSDTARIARAQERELREWLFVGGPAARTDPAATLREAAAALEAEHAVRFDVVAAGEVGALPDGMLQAAREAMTNAARHAGGDVSVYLEGGMEAVEVIVTDRGPGFSPDDVPADRLGVRESILGRMRRAGGTATIAAGPGGRGTSVTLRATREEGERHA